MSDVVYNPHLDEFVPEAEPEKKAEELPKDTESFLHWLHRYWPHRCPSLGDSPEAIHRYAGARALIDSLLHQVLGSDESEW